MGPTETSTQRCNPVPTFWPEDIAPPPGWGVPCTAVPTSTSYAAGLPGLLRMTPASTEIELMQQHIMLGVRLYNLLVGFFGAVLVAGAGAGFWKLKK